MDLESSTFIPSPDEHAQLKDEFVILVLRILTKHCKYFQQFANIVPAHIPQKYSKEMSRQSQVVSTKITTIKPLVQAQSPFALATKLICFSKLGWHRPAFVLQGNIAGTSLLVCSLPPLPPPKTKTLCIYICIYYYLLHNMLYMGNASIILLPEIDWQQLLVFHQIYFKTFHVVKTCNMVLLSSQPPFGRPDMIRVFYCIYPHKGTRKRYSILFKLKKYIYIFQRNLSETLNL